MIVRIETPLIVFTSRYVFMCLFCIASFFETSASLWAQEPDSIEGSSLAERSHLVPVPSVPIEENESVANLKKQLEALNQRLSELEEARQEVETTQTDAVSPSTDSETGTEEAALMGTILGESGSGWSIGGYGEFLVSTKFYGPDPNKEYSPSKYRQTDVDLARVVFFAGYDFTTWLSFQSEIEFEHGGTGSAMEVEWDEFGEYELEVEKGGEIVLEQAYLEFKFGKEFNLPLDLGLRLGHLLVPVGMISSYHTPNMFPTVGRAEAEEALLPSTWHETGAEFFLSVASFNFQLQGITGLDSTGFASSTWIGGGTQRRFEAVRSNDWAVAMRADYAGVPGLMFGGSFYTSNTTENRPKRDMDDISARVYVTDFHLRYHYGPFRMAGEALFGFLENADAITEKNSSLSKYLEVPRTPVASSVYGYFLESSLDLIGLIDPTVRHRLDLFVHYDGYDTMWEPPQKGSGFDNPLLQRQVVTTGMNYFPHPRVVFKAEYLSRWINKDKHWKRHQHEVNCGLGFVL